ncbi:MAG: GtrA family protein [Ferruginibacter sp.]
MNNALDTRLFKFGLVGLSGMVIDFSVTWLCKERWGINKYLANSLGFCLAVTSNFLLNRYWTFENGTQPFTQQFARFWLVSLSGLVINNILLYLLVKKLPANFYLIKLLVIALVFFWNYFVNILFTFN